MIRTFAWTAATLMALTGTPALADDSAIDTHSMMEAAAPPTHNATDLPVSGFDLAALTGQQSLRFMATMESTYEAGYRISAASSPVASGSNPGIASLIVPEEFAYRSTAQDSGVDALVPGQFLSTSVRADLQSDTGPAARDKSSVGLRLPF
ncbi:MAG: hypothetical protein AAGM33_07825 [Pseudomonadota bacterium]